MKNESQHSHVYVLALNMSERLALRTDDVLGDVRTLLDSAWEETDNEEEAVHLTIEWRDGGWSTVDRDDFVSQRSI